jgi:hypothetical protein
MSMSPTKCANRRSKKSIASLSSGTAPNADLFYSKLKVNPKASGVRVCALTAHATDRIRWARMTRFGSRVFKIAVMHNCRPSALVGQNDLIA